MAAGAPGTEPSGLNINDVLNNNEGLNDEQDDKSGLLIMRDRNLDASAIPGNLAGATGKTVEHEDLARATPEEACEEDNHAHG